MGKRNWRSARHTWGRMSRENVEVVRRGFEAYARGDTETLLRLVDPEIEWKQVEEPAAVHGPRAGLESVARWDETWDDLAISVEEYIDAGENVVAVVRSKGRGKASGVAVEQVSYQVFTVRDGRVVRMREYGPGERAEALEAAGLREEGQ